MSARIENIERSDAAHDWGHMLKNIGAIVLRYGLVIILLWVGALKFTAYEAEATQGLIANTPFLSWLLGITNGQGAAMVLGVIEILLGLMIAVRSVAPQISAIGSMGAIVMFLITLSLLLTTPGVWQPGYGFPFLSMLGSFLAKDLLLLGAAIWTAGEALRAAGVRGNRMEENSV